jgi:hypothetical protein
MNTKSRIIGFTIGLISLVWLFVIDWVLPPGDGTRLSMTEYCIYGFGSALCIGASLWQWKCADCRGVGTAPTLVLDGNNNFAPATVTCASCGGDGKWRG